MVVNASLIRREREVIENLIIFKYTGRLTHEDSLYFYKVQPLQKSSVRWKKCLLIHLPTEIYGETVANMSVCLLERL